MVRLKTPLLSMDAHGSVGDALTFQSSTRRKFAREKPHLPYSLTLNQQYQRWLYEDYCAYWHTLTTVQKNVYRDAGHRFHRTAFQQFMSVMLATLPDINIWCKLDDAASGICHDSSRNAYHGTVIGASPASLAIDGAYYFDMINDEVTFGTHMPLGPTVSVVAFVNFDALNTTQYIARNGDTDGRNLFYFLVDFQRVWFGWRHDDAGVDRRASFLHAGIISPGQTHCIIALIDGITGVRQCYVDNVLCYDNPRVYAIGLCETPLTFSAVIGQRLGGYLDNFMIYNRIIDPAHVARWSGRRYLS